MTVNTTDATFSTTLSGKVIPYATASACYHQTDPRDKGIFSLDLQGTGLAVQSDV